MKHEIIQKKLWTIAPEILFVVSLLLPAVKYDQQYIEGLTMFAMGPIGVLSGHFAWFANVGLYMSRRNINSNKPVLAFRYSVLSLCIGVTFLLYKKMPMGDAGEYAYHTLVGYYIWLLSMLVAAIQAFVKHDIRLTLQ